MSKRNKPSRTDDLRKMREMKATIDARKLVNEIETNVFPIQQQAQDDVTMQDMSTTVSEAETTNLNVDESADIQTPFDGESPAQKEDSTVKPKKEKKVPKEGGRKKAQYQLNEVLALLELKSQGKSLDELHNISKRPQYSLLYKLYDKKRGLGGKTQEEIFTYFKVDYVGAEDTVVRINNYLASVGYTP